VEPLKYSPSEFDDNVLVKSPEEPDIITW